MERRASLRDTGRDMPDAAKLSRQGSNGHFAREAVRQGVGAGTWIHSNAWCDAGRPAPFLLEGVPVAVPDVWDIAPDGRWHPRERLLAAIARAGRDDVLVPNPAFEACWREASISTRAAMYAESFPCGRDSVGVATMIDDIGPDGTHRRIIAALGTMGNLVPKGHPAEFPLAPKVRSVRPTGGRIEGALPHGYRWARHSDQPGHRNAGYVVKLAEDTPEPPARKRERGQRGAGAKARAKERRKARRAAERAAANN